MSTTRDDMLDRLVRWEQARAQGQSPSPEDLCGDCPDRAGELRRLIGKLGRVGWLDRPLEVGTGPEDERGETIPHDTNLPRTLADRYRLDALIGVGGFGRVYRALDTWLDRPVAVKIPRADRLVGAEEVDQCRMEAKKVARLRHPNIVPVHDVGRDGASCFIVSEWIDGQNLAERMEQGRLPLDVAVRIVAEVADALDYAHAQGYVHRDIKPANILLDGGGRAYLTDFGIAVVEEELLKGFRAAGTLPYMAPEQLDETLGPADHRADIHALGVVLFELLTGRRPFESGSPLELRERILAGEFAPPRSIEPALPEGLDRICQRCLARRPDDRYADAGALAGDLRTLVRAS